LTPDGDKRRFERVAVLMGGPSLERVVSLNSGKAVAQGLRAAGYTVTPVDVTRRDLELPADVEAVFIALHGEFGEDGEVQALLNNRGIPYAGSGPAASQAAFDKRVSKATFVAQGIATAAYQVFSAGDRRELPLPVVVKPARQGSSLGVSMVFEEADWPKALADGFEYGAELIVESYVDGRELTVGILGEEALPIVEILAPDGNYSFLAKYTGGRTRYLTPAPLAASLYRHCQELALRAFRALDCRGFGRVDLRLSSKGEPFALELNSIPGFTATSLLPKAAAAAGIAFPDLCHRIMHAAGNPA